VKSINLHAIFYLLHAMPFISLACVEPEVVQPTNKNLIDLSFTLEWSPVTTQLLQSYTLSYSYRSQLDVMKRQTDEQVISVENISTNSTSFTVEDLTPYSSYCFWLEAVYSQKGFTFSCEKSDKICNINTPPLGKFFNLFV